MSRQSMLYALYSLGIVALFVLATRDGYSPFADGGARGIGAIGGRSGFVGPTHK
ncbi:hypothetical protein [Sphingomonas alpina]|uniref:Uncharacterized protein n=1 Tax=Sphingomonas alpina TaxID=653931 RepID=A0A7H0LJH7_9SPHN|nr:hypothetical protein [Sphingomonas alpina]QNQ09830.1 hypothetical protein H3Z74_00790 [Sphingomonas alpina]